MSYEAAQTLHIFIHRSKKQNVRSRRLLTFASSVRHHDSPVLALGAREAVLGLRALQAVKRTGAAVARVEHVAVVARRADHHVVVLLRVFAVPTVERTLCKHCAQRLTTFNYISD